VDDRVKGAPSEGVLESGRVEETALDELAGEDRIAVPVFEVIEGDGGVARLREHADHVRADEARAADDEHAAHGFFFRWRSCFCATIICWYTDFMAQNARPSGPSRKPPRST
jgi:hypothetical protein